MYIGRIVAIGMTKAGDPAVMYRVSSRSFPNRRAVVGADKAAIVPRPGAEEDLARNPYISYNCLRTAGEWAVASNGSQTDPIAEKIAMGMPVRDAIALGLLALDYEKDSLDTPRIVAVVGRAERSGFLGIIRRDALLVRKFELRPGEAHYVATYVRNRPEDENIDRDFDAASADECAGYIVDGGVFAGFDHAVTSAAVLVRDGRFEFAGRVVDLH